MGDRANVIDRVDVYGYDLTYAHGDYVMSSGRVVNVLPSTVVRIRTRDGVEGFGETCPLGSTYLPAFARGRAGRVARARAGAHRRRCGEPRRCHRADGRDPARPRVREERRSMSRAGTSWGERPASPSRRCSAARSMTALPLYVAVPLGPADAMAAFVERERAGGIHHFQLKLGAAPEEDLERVAAVHAVTGPEDALIGDANGALATAGRDHRGSAARGLRPAPARAAVPDARGMHRGPPPDDAADGPRRGHHRPADPRPGRRGRRDGPRQPQDRPRRRPDQGARSCATPPSPSG